MDERAQVADEPADELAVVLPLPDKLAYTIPEAAALISATPAQVRHAITARRLRHSRLGEKRGVVITKAQLQDFLDRNEIEAQQ